jgi:hypothetical protein
MSEVATGEQNMIKVQSVLRLATMAAGVMVVSASLTWGASAQRTIKAPDIGAPENAPDTVYFEKDYFEYVDERLYALEEPSLWKMSRDPNTESIRFFWVPEDGEVLMLRVDLTLEGEAFMTFKRSAGINEETWGAVASTQSRKLSEKELKELRFRFDFMKYWRIERDDPEDYANSEGPLWLFEAIHGSKYHAVHRSNPTQGEARRLGLLMLSFVELGEVDVTWPRRPEIN